jgi:soluble lytic murein transglycosylase-like protein
MASSGPADQSKRFIGQRLKTATLAAAMLGCLLGAPQAHADLYGYVDADGVAHFSDRRLDDRYTLFLRNASIDRPAPEAGTQLGDLTRHKLYRYVVNHPRIATVQPIIDQIAHRHDVDPALVKAVMAVESGFNPGAVSPKGAIGLMQVIPDTGARFGVTADARRTVEQKLADPHTNIAAGVRYLRWLMELYPNNLELTLAAYNAGEGAVRRYNNQIPPYPETRQYVSTVMQFYRFYQPGALQANRGAAVQASQPGRIKLVVGGRRNMP